MHAQDSTAVTSILNIDTRDPRIPLSRFPRVRVRVEQGERLIAFNTSQEIWEYVQTLSKYLNHIHRVLNTAGNDKIADIGRSGALFDTVGTITGATSTMDIDMHDIAPIEIQKVFDKVPSLAEASIAGSLYNPSHVRFMGFHIYMKLYKRPVETTLGYTIGFVKWDVPAWLDPYVL